MRSVSEVKRIDFEMTITLTMSTTVFLVHQQEAETFQTKPVLGFTDLDREVVQNDAKLA